MLKKFQQHINKSFSFLKDKKLLVAISGGIDSVVLSDLLYKSDLPFSIAHCNFNLRGKESDKDEKFVIDLAKEYQQKCFVKRFNTKVYASQNNISIQMAARDLRYDWFEKLIQEYHYNYLFTAHHADDNLETFLINFTRGTGLEGLTGIPQINNNKIRPLLPFSREEIENYAKAQNLKWREDRSNAEIKYFRNKLRHEVIPVLKQINPNLLNSFLQTIDNLQGSRTIVSDRIIKIKDEVISTDGKNSKFKIQNLKSLNNPKAYLFELLNTYGFTEWDDIYDLLSAQSGKQVFSKTHRLLKDRNYLLLSKIPKEIDSLKKIEISEIQKESVINGFTIQIEKTNKYLLKNENAYKKDSNHIIFVDKEKIKFPLIVRKWETGDYFYPLGMQGKKKLSKYFKDEKLSILDKENIWLLCTGNEIIWVINNRLDDRFKITDKTKNILKIEIKK